MVELLVGYGICVCCMLDGSRRDCSSHEAAHNMGEQPHFSWEIGCDEEVDGDDDGPSSTEAGQELAICLIHLKLKGRLSAKDVCTIATYAKAAGLTGPATEFAFRLNAPSGHYNRHLNRVLHIDEHMDDAYTLEVPGHDKYMLERTVHKLPTFVPHEALADEIASTPALVEALRALRENNELPDAFVQHPVVQNAPATADVWPLCLYVDGIPLTKRDGMLAFYVYNMISEKRHLCVTLRRSEMCFCGCGGWCSLHAVWSYFMWTFSCLAEGEWPQRRHDFSEFAHGDEVRKHKAGMALMYGALVHIKGDWSEFVHTFGFPSWSTVLHPCSDCWTTEDELQIVEGFSLVSTPCPKTNT